MTETQKVARIFEYRGASLLARASGTVGPPHRAHGDEGSHDSEPRPMTSLPFATPDFQPLMRQLRDGTSVLLRPVGPQDRERLQALVGRLSARSQQRRFFAPLSKLTSKQLRHLTEIDYHDPMAWAVLDPSEATEPALGVARYIRLPEDPKFAEAAVAVVDSHQCRGIGTLLFGSTVQMTARLERGSR